MNGMDCKNERADKAHLRVSVGEAKGEPEDEAGAQSMPHNVRHVIDRRFKPVIRVLNPQGERVQWPETLVRLIARHGLCPEIHLEQLAQRRAVVGHVLPWCRQSRWTMMEHDAGRMLTLLSLSTLSSSSTIPCEAVLEYRPLK